MQNEKEWVKTVALQSQLANCLSIVCRVRARLMHARAISSTNILIESKQENCC